MKLYGLKNCDSCKKALKALKAAGHDVEFVDVRADGVPAATLKGWLAVHGPVLINTRSTTWRGLDQSARSRAETDPQGLLAEHPTVIKRPVIEVNGQTHVGWTKDVQAALL
jgi:arsenate reductase